jgi:glycine cleavage system H protein
MSNVPADLKYTKSHEWVRTVKTGEACAVVESVKAASDVYAPLDGQVTAGNPKLSAEPETVNAEPYGAGWLMRLRPAPGALGAAQLLSAAEYQKVLDAEGG